MKKSARKYRKWALLVPLGLAVVLIPACATQQRVRETEASLRTAQHQGEGALIYRVRSSDGKMADARTELHYKETRGGYRPGRVRENEPTVQFERAGQAAELRVTHPDYCEFSRPVRFVEGRVIVWDDIVLQRVTTDTAVTITGAVVLEDNADPSGIPVAAWEGGTARATTDGRGRFELKGMRPGKIQIVATKPGYEGLYVDLSTSAGKRKGCVIHGFRQRGALVEWAYQPDKDSRDLSGTNIVSGRAVLLPHVLDRVSFGKGFVQVSGLSDFLICQREGALILRNFDVRSATVPAIKELGAVRFEDVREAPEGGFERRDYTLKEGVVHACLCYDGLHFGKMRVIKILDGIDSIRQAQETLRRAAVR